MIISYKANMAGPYHIEAGLPCQDSFAIKKGNGSYIIAAVADGLGSELYSDIVFWCEKPVPVYAAAVAITPASIRIKNTANRYFLLIFII